MLIRPGLFGNQPRASAEPSWATGINVRFWDNRIESLGLFGPLRAPSGDQALLPGDAKYRALFTTPSPVTGQILAGSTTHLRLLQFDPGSSTPGAPPRWADFDVAPSGMAAASDALTDPSSGRVEIPPVWWFADQDDLVVGARANVATDPAYAWDRNSANDFVALAGSPTGAVGGGIMNRILFLMGCTSFTDPDPQRFLTVRWSDRYNFEEWTPSDTNLSGEQQLEGGSRIVGGGVTGFGHIVWTDRRMALFVENGDIATVYARRYVDGGRGLLANRAWCEADGVVWWLDESRTLNAFDGGRPIQIPNPLRYLTTELITDKDVARIYLTPNPEYGEIIIWFCMGHSTSTGNPDAALVYSYQYECWSYWRLTRNAWCQRFGVIPNLAIDNDNRVFRHDIDLGFGQPWNKFDPLDDAFWQVPAPIQPPAADITPYAFLIASNLLVTDDPAHKRMRNTRVTIDHIPAPAAGAEADALTVDLIGYGEPSMTSLKQPRNQRSFAQGDPGIDFRVGGKALQLRIEGRNQKTVWRFGDVGLTPVGAGVK